ncbi:type II 3-dehydroquinate dehydratase [Kiloniella sp. b19]|uniref:type II 3-dehydroquinate dehydratase n=1 Tax=Kiloniella sp. GXU_MW_B19 TaxID=3141326 RepID=UPI0031D79831
MDYSVSSVLLLNGPNLNLLGTRQPEIYGYDTLADLESQCQKRARSLGLELECRQSNWEGQLIGWVHEARGKHEGIIINPAALTHTSVALMDALLGVDRPVVEVHLSNIHSREEFRHHSYVSRVAQAVICGLGPQGYLLAMDAMAHLLNSDKED